MKTQVKVHARRWFQKSYGNTYHSVEVTVKDLETGEEQEFYEPFTYGYGDHYRVTATKVLRKHTNILESVQSDYDLHSWRVLEELEEKGILVKFFCEDVNRKKDL